MSVTTVPVTGSAAFTAEPEQFSLPAAADLFAGPYEVVVFVPDQWQEIKALRRTALAEDGGALVPASEDQHGTEEDWRRTFETGTWAGLRSEGELIALARSTVGGPGELASHQRFIEKLWIDPRYRKSGAATQFMKWFMKRERVLGVSELLLWVMTDNVSARALYAKLGFTSTGTKKSIGVQMEECFHRAI